MKPKYLNDGDPWILGENIPDCDLFFSQIWLHCFVNSFEKHTGRAYKKILCRYEGYSLGFCFGDKDSNDVAEHIVHRIIEEPGYAEEVNRNILLEADKLRAYSETIPQDRETLQRLSDAHVWEIYETHQRIHEQEYYPWCWIPVACDMFHNNLTGRMKNYLREKGVNEEKLNEYFVTLTQPTKKSLIFIEQEDLLHIAEKIEKERVSLTEQLPPTIASALEEHCKKYYYTKHLWVSGEYTIEDYLQQLKDIFAMEQSPTVIIKKQHDELEKTRKAREQLLEKLGIEKEWRKIFDAFGDFMVTKIYRRYAQLLAVHHMSPVLKEIARRKNLTEKQVRFMLPAEVKAALLENTVDEHELLERTKKCVYYAERGYDKIFTGKEAEELAKQTERKFSDDMTEFRGESGCVGYAKGKVKVIIRAGDMAKMDEGDILVSIATDPDIVPAMKKAAGIVTDQGGVTSHAAIVSRELGIPCVIGTKIATRVLKDGDLVEVDANKGVVRKIS